MVSHLGYFLNALLKILGLVLGIYLGTELDIVLLDLNELAIERVCGWGEGGAAVFQLGLLLVAAVDTRVVYACRLEAVSS